MPYTPLPPPPQRNQPTTFADDGDAFLAALPQFGADMEAARLTALDAIAAAPIAVAAANYKGEYSAAVTYQVGQCVSYGGARWYAKTVNTGVTPADGANWGAIRDIPNPAGQAGKVLVTDGSQSQWQPLLPTVYKVAQYTASATFTVPAGVYVIRPYAFGAGAAGTTSASGGGGGCAYGDIAVTPGTSVTLSIVGGVAKVTVGGVDLLTANPASGVTAGTASKHASVTNGGAYSGGAGSTSTPGAGGASSGSPLGVGSVGGAGGGGGWGGAGINGAGGGGVGSDSSTGRSGDALTVPSTDAILSGIFGSRGVASTAGGRGSGGPAGCGGGYGSAGGGAGGFGAGGGGTGGNSAITNAGEGGFGGGGGGASVSGGYGGDGGYGGGGGRGAAVGGAGGAAVIRIYY